MVNIKIYKKADERLYWKRAVFGTKTNTNKHEMIREGNIFKKGVQTTIKTTNMYISLFWGFLY